MLLASVQVGTRPYRRKSLCTDIVVHENRYAVEAVHYKRTPFRGDRIEKSRTSNIFTAAEMLGKKA